MTANPTRSVLPLLVAFTASGCVHNAPAGVTPGSVGSSTPAIVKPTAAPVLRGTIVGYDGKPARQAEVHLGRKTVAADRNGQFALPLPGGPLDFVSITAVNHAEYRLVVAPENGLSPIRVRLGTYQRAAPITSPKLVQVEKTPDGKLRTLRAVAMTAAGDGTFRAELPVVHGKVAYEVGGFAGGRSVNGTDSDAFVYDGGGDYMSVLDARKGATKVTVVLDPNKLPPAGKRPALLRAPNRASVKLTAIRRDIDLERTRLMKQMAASKGPVVIMADAPRAAAWRKQIDLEKDALVRQALMVAYFGVTMGPVPGRDAGLAKRALAEIPADSRLWWLAPNAVMRVMAQASDPVAFVERVAASAPTHRAAMQLLLNVLFRARQAGDHATLTRIIKFVKTHYSDTPMAHMVAMFAPDRAVHPGAPMPAFALPAVGGHGATITNESFAGKPVLVKFWATWCEPCVAEMPWLQELHKKFGSKLAIYTINVDDSRARFDAFRNKHPMPWLHSVLDARLSAVAEKKFGVVALPSSFLFGRDGRAMATGWTLRNRAVLESMAKAAVRSGAKRAAPAHSPKHAKMH